MEINIAPKGGGTVKATLTKTYNWITSVYGLENKEETLESKEDEYGLQWLCRVGRETLTRVKECGSHTMSHQKYSITSNVSLHLELLLLTCMLILITTLVTLAVSEMSILGKDGVVSGGTIVGGGGVAARIIPGIGRKRNPLQFQEQLNKPCPTLGNDTFNKGILMNAGFLTALDNPAHGVMYHCFIFHDVDLLPEDDRNMYTCPQQPRHLSVAVNEFIYSLPYRTSVGGVFAIRTDHFLRVNGYSNLYWGWGGEDDDMGMSGTRTMFYFTATTCIGRYTMIKHEKRRPLPHKVRFKLVRTSRSRYRLDGLNTVQYGLGKITERPGYTHVTVDVGQQPPPPPPKPTLAAVGKKN